MKKKLTTGLVIGKFMPLHQGHELLIDFARHYVDRLFVVVDNVPQERYAADYVPGKVRVNWVKQSLSDIEVLYLPKVMPQNPGEHSHFWKIWRENLLSLLPKKPDYIFAAELYGLPLAKILNSTFIPVELEREAIPISGTNIRADLFNNWHFLSDAAKPDFTLRICIGGPESSGKTTLVKKLAKALKTIAVPEYARSYIEAQLKLNKDYKLKFEEMKLIAFGQSALENHLIHRANKILICDTDIWATSLWSKWLFDGKFEKEIAQLAKQKSYDLYLLTKPDINWKKDSVRYFPEQEKRVKFFEEYKKILDDHKINYEFIGGRGEQRTKRAIHIIEKFIQKNFNYQYFIQKLNK